MYRATNTLTPKRMKLFFAFIALCTPANMIPLAVPQSLANHAIWYKETRQLNRFSCGFNAAFNACNFEQCCGFHNPFSNYAAFERIGSFYANSWGKHPKASLYNYEVTALAEKIAKQAIFPFTVKQGRVSPLFDTPTNYTYPHGSSKREKDACAKRAVEAREAQLIKGIRKELAAIANKTAIIHFGCFVKSRGEGHIVLVSLLQNWTGRGLYIFDNMNAPLVEGSDLNSIIEHLKVTFNISARNQFKGPQLPHYWPTAPRGRHS